MSLLFLVPPWWPALLVLPAALWLGYVRSRAAAARARSLFGQREMALCGERVAVALRAACAAGAVLLATLALLQPVFGESDSEPVGPDVVLCVDVSRSMAARDTAPTRLGAVQQQIAELAGVATGTRLALVTFAGDARLVVPLTTDLDAVVVLARDLAAGASGRGGTNPGAAIEVGVRALQRGGGAGRGSLVLLTDGEDFVGSAQAAAAQALANGVPVHCIGFGQDGGSKIVVETETGETFLRDASGDEVVTRLLAESLAAVAMAGGGRFERDRGPATLSALHAAVLAPAARAAAAHDAGRPVAHRFQWPLFGALLLWMLRWCLSERRR